MLTADRLREMVDYDPATGVFTWKVRATGAVAGSVDAYGYVVIQVDGKNYKAHRLAFLYMTGEWPFDEIDHIDGDRVNNAWTNLREANSSQNKRNAGTRKDNKLGVKGIHRRGSKFRAEIQHGGEKIYLGLFNTIAEAKAVRDLAARDLHGKFARAG